MLSCFEATRLMSQAQERKLTLKEHLLLRFHVVVCSGCRNFKAQIGTLRAIARAYARGGKERAEPFGSRWNGGEVMTQ